MTMMRSLVVVMACALPWSAARAEPAAPAPVETAPAKRSPWKAPVIATAAPLAASLVVASGAAVLPLMAASVAAWIGVGALALFELAQLPSTSPPTGVPRQLAFTWAAMFAAAALTVIAIGLVPPAYVATHVVAAFLASRPSSPEGQLTRRERMQWFLAVDASVHGLLASFALVAGSVLGAALGATIALAGLVSPYTLIFWFGAPIPLAQFVPNGGLITLTAIPLFQLVFAIGLMNAGAVVATVLVPVIATVVMQREEARRRAQHGEVLDDDEN